MTDVQDVLDLIEDLSGDASVPRNVKAKFKEIGGALKDKGQLSITVNKALNELDEIGDDSNLQPYVRTQIWNIVSLLEKI